MTSSAASISPRARTGAGVLLILAAMSIVPLIDVTAKALSQHGMPVLQITLMRMLGGALVIAPILVRFHGPRALVPRRFAHAVLLGIYILGTATFFLVPCNTSRLQKPWPFPLFSLLSLRFCPPSS